MTIKRVASRKLSRVEAAVPAPASTASAGARSCRQKASRRGDTASGFAAALRVFVAVVLCVGLMWPSNIDASVAYAGSSDDFGHGTVSIASDSASSSNVINLKVGETATISVTPYVHLQYKGCGMPGKCPDNCEEFGRVCFVEGFGCTCEKDPVSRTAKVTTSVGDSGIVSASEVVEGEWINGDNLDLKDTSRPVTKNGTITLTANAVGTTQVTVSAETDSYGYATDLLEWWNPAKTTFTVKVSADGASDVTDPVSQTDVTAKAWRESQYGTPPNGTPIDDKDGTDSGMHVKVTFSFDDEVVISDADALLSSMNLKTTLREAGYTATAEGNNLIVDITASYALFAGKIASDGGDLAGITVGGSPVKLSSFATLADTGLAFEPVSMTVGTDTEPASTTFEVTHCADVRSMNHIVWLTNGGSGTLGKSILANTGEATQSTVAHHHKWYEFTPATSAYYIVDGGSSALDEAGYTLTDNQDGTFTITAKENKAGEILSADNYTDSFFHKTGLALGEDVTGVSMPQPDQSGDFGMTFPDEPSSVTTSMGRYPAGMTQFTLTPSDGAIDAYRKSFPDATVKDMLQAWADSITSVTVGGVALEGKAFDEWKSQLTNPTDDSGKLNYYDFAVNTKSVSLKLPVALFDTTQEKSTKSVAIESSTFGRVSGSVTYRNLGTDVLVVRILDTDGQTVKKTTTLTMDQLRSLTVQQHYSTASNCGMAGLRSYSSEGVLLSDVLEAAGVTFSEGMTLKVRVNDQLESNGDETTRESGYLSNGTHTYESLMGTDRYYYPAMWDNETTYDELGGKTIYQVLSADMDAWKGTDDAAAFLRQKLGETKQQVSPILAWSWNEGVVAWGGSNPSEQSGYNGYTGQSALRFLYGLSTDEAGNAIDDNTTFSNTYAVFGIDIIGGESTDSQAAGDKDDTGIAPGQKANSDQVFQGSSASVAKTGEMVPLLALAGLCLAAFAALFVSAAARRRAGSASGSKRGC